MMSILLRAVVLLLVMVGAKLHANNGDSGLANLSDRPEAQDKTIAVFADALYWHASETVDWAFTIAPNGNFERTRYRTLSFGWDPGFRVGLGYNMHHDQWDTRFYYTWFKTDITDHASGAITSAFLAARLSLLEPFETGKIRLHLLYNMFDWDLGRSFLVSKYLSLRPYIGAKGGWINQEIHLKWTKPILGNLLLASENVQNNFRGGGPKGGVSGKWILGNAARRAFSIVGNFAAAYMWGHWTLRDVYTDNLSTKDSIQMKDRNFGSFMVQALLGLGWDFNFDKNRSHFALKVGYEIEDWLNQFQVFSDASGTQNSDLVLQGLTVDLRLDF